MNDLKYVIDSKGDAIFYFCSIHGETGFDDWGDFLIVVNVIQTYFSPDEMKYAGITDIIGHFTKNRIRVEMECTSMLGVMFSIPKERLIEGVLDEAYQLLNAIWHRSLECKINNEFKRKSSPHKNGIPK